jgi:hypothetical protein
MSRLALLQILTNSKWNSLVQFSNCSNPSRTFDRTDILDSEYNNFMGQKDMRITRNVGL